VSAIDAHASARGGSGAETGVSPASMAMVSVRLAQRIFQDLRETRVLLVGAGRTMEITAACFAAQRPCTMTIAECTLQRADALARRYAARTMLLTELPRQLADFDIVASCIGNGLPIIGLGMVDRASRLRRHRPIFMVDLAVPRDTEPEVGRLEDVFLYTVRDLGIVLQASDLSCSALPRLCTRASIRPQAPRPRGDAGRRGK
jgi:glutamyl-tRNA reductase